MVKKNNLKVLMVAGLLAVSQATTAFAGAWQADSVGWWYQNDDKSYPKSEWMQDTDGKWYYFDANGYMVANKWEWVDGNKDGIAECYLFSPSGAAYMNMTTPDGYTVDINGAWVVDGTPQTKSVSVGPGGATTGTTTKTTSFSGGGSGGSGGGGGGSSSGGGGSSTNKKDDTNKTDTTTKTVYNTYGALSVTDGSRSWLTDYGKSEVDKKEYEILDSIITDGMSDFQKEMAISDYLLNNTVYSSTDYPNHMTSYGTLIEGKGACAGFNSAFMELCQKAGLEARMNWTKGLTSTYGSEHAWALVKIDGDWYMYDKIGEKNVSDESKTDERYRCIVNDQSYVTGWKYGSRAIWYYLKSGTENPSSVKDEKQQFALDVKNYINDVNPTYVVNMQDSNQKETANDILAKVKESGSGTYTILCYTDAAKSNEPDWDKYGVAKRLNHVIAGKKAGNDVSWDDSSYAQDKAIDCKYLEVTLENLAVSHSVDDFSGIMYTPSGCECFIYTVEYTAPEEDASTTGEETDKEGSGAEDGGSESGNTEGGAGSESGGAESGESESGGYTGGESGEGGSNEAGSNSISLDNISEIGLVDDSEVIDIENFSIKDDVSEDIASDDEIENIEDEILEDVVDEQESEEVA